MYNLPIILAAVLLSMAASAIVTLVVYLFLRLFKYSLRRWLYWVVWSSLTLIGMAKLTLYWWLVIRPL